MTSIAHSWRAAFGFAAILLIACGSDPPETSTSPDPSNPLDAERARLGGDTTIVDDSQNAFGYPARNASEEHRARFFVGNSFFKQNWVTAPSSTEARDGLGPLFNARSCSSCHLLDGRGRPPLTPDEPIVGLLFRLSAPTGGSDPAYGGQLQPYGVQGVPGEAKPRIDYTELPGSYADGSSHVLLQPNYSFEGLAYGPMMNGILTSPRVAPQLIGLGLLEAVTEETLMKAADPDDANGDGISGRPNRVTSLRDGKSTIGRFGWKANQPNVEEQTAGAFLGDMGITTWLHPNEDCTNAEPSCREAISGGSPEIEDARLDDVVLYTSLLAVPARRKLDDPQVIRGESLFETTGCTACHLSKLETGPSERFFELANQTIHPFTDLLLHDMGPELSDDRPDCDASEQEWRTPPLWGIGLIGTVNGHTRLLHDGRARSIEEAILWHGGEGANARARFVALDAASRQAMLSFLETL